ncbi:hypothetical protein PINS_up006629 [Pythium insidiosum]|nr:hypothetical protein PINS_up006629 [Pythium insidiosum]
MLDRPDLLESSPSPLPSSLKLDPARFVRAERVLGLVGVVAITFMCGSGGPLGSESIVAEGGPLVALLGFLLYPLVVTVPYAAVITELCAAFPEDGGFTIWVMNAFGPFWSIQVGYWSWVAGVMSLAVYPGYVLDTCRRFMTVDIHHGEYFVKAAIAVVLTLPSLAGTRLISRSTATLLAILVLSMTAYSLYGFSHAHASDRSVLLQTRHRASNNTTSATDSSSSSPIRWVEILNSLYWNYEGFRMASVFGGQVRNPAGVYSRAIWIVVGLSVAMYVLPLVATVVSGSLAWQQFQQGAYERAALALGGTTLRVLVTASSFATCIGLFVSGLFACATEIAGMADNRLLPAAVATRNAQFQSPHVAISSTLVTALGLMLVDAATLLPVANTFSGLVAIMIFLSAIQIRRAMPYIPRPSRVPGGVATLVAASVVPVTTSAYITVRACMTSTTSVLLILGFAAPPLLYAVLRVRRHETLLYR